MAGVAIFDIQAEIPSTPVEFLIFRWHNMCNTSSSTISVNLKTKSTGVTCTAVLRSGGGRVRLVKYQLNSCTISHISVV